MSVLFTPGLLGNMEIKNRFVHSATYECMADHDGKVTEKMIARYRRLAQGGVGLIIPGYLFIMPNGKAVHFQTGIHSDDIIEGLRELVEAVHNEGGKIVFQLAHAGRQTRKKTIGQTPIAPSRGSMDSAYMVKPREMTEGDIQEVIDAFGAAARRAREAGADGVQIHAAHGYLVSQFLSPFFNKRTDSWGGSDERRFRFLKEIVLEIKQHISDEMLLLIKLNTRDFTPTEGITPELAMKYSEWLAELPVDGLEISCGTLSYSPFNQSRGGIPIEEIITNFPWWRKIIGKRILGKMQGEFDLEDGYNMDAAKLIKPAIGEIPLLVVGGMRSLEHMEEVVNKDWADFVSMSRPFIREPGLVNKLKEGKSDSASCISCNKCFAAVANDMAVQCYVNGFPKH